MIDEGDASPDSPYTIDEIIAQARERYSIPRRVIFSDAAKRDLDEIWEFSEDRWNADQADRYLRSIGQAAAALAAGDFAAAPSIL